MVYLCRIHNKDVSLKCKESIGRQSIKYYSWKGDLVGTCWDKCNASQERGKSSLKK